MPIRLGPVGVSPTLTITNFGIDSNVFNDSVDPQRDFTLTATPKVLARVRAGRAVLSGSLATGLVYYQTFEDERAIEYATEGRADVDVGTFRPWFLASRIDTSERLNVEIDLRAPRVQTNLAGGLRVIATPRFGIVAAARRSSLQFDEGSVVDGVPLSQTLNSDVSTLEGGVEYYPTPLTTFSLVASLQQDRFDESPGRDADSLRIMPSVRMVAPAIVEGSFGVGYRRFDGKDPLLPDFSGVIAQATVSHRFGDVLKLDLNVSRDIQYSFEVDRAVLYSFVAQGHASRGSSASLSTSGVRRAATSSIIIRLQRLSALRTTRAATATRWSAGAPATGTGRTSASASMSSTRSVTAIDPITSTIAPGSWARCPSDSSRHSAPCLFSFFSLCCFRLRLRRSRLDTRSDRRIAFPSPWSTSRR